MILLYSRGCSNNIINALHHSFTRHSERIVLHHRIPGGEKKKNSTSWPPKKKNRLLCTSQSRTNYLCGLSSFFFFFFSFMYFSDLSVPVIISPPFSLSHSCTVLHSKWAGPLRHPYHPAVAERTQIRAEINTWRDVSRWLHTYVQKYECIPPPEEGVFVPTRPGDVFWLVTWTFVSSIQGISTCGDSHSESRQKQQTEKTDYKTLFEVLHILIKLLNNS